MDKNEMLAELMLDLKMALDTEISTAEATHCIGRAVEDLSRKIPRERIYEHTWIEAVTDDSFTTPATANATLIVNAVTLSGEADGATMTMANYFLDVPRPLAFLITDANNSITRATITVRGTDVDGVYREEKFYRHKGKSQIGKVYFYTISQVILTEIAGSASAADTLSIGTAAPDTAGKEVWVQLSNPIEPGSEAIHSAASKGGTRYILDTDYKMDYANGRICFTSAGSMAVSTTYYANYDRAPCTIDISSIIPELIRIVKVIYPVDKVPEQSVAFSVWENMLTIGSPRAGTSQEALVDDEHLAIFYEAKHAPPTDFGSGSYPENLDQIVLIGAAGYALMVEALQYEQSAATDLGLARAAIVKVTGSGIHGLITAALDIAGAKAALAGTALGKVSGLLTPIGTQDNASDVLSEIHDMEAYLRDLIIKLSDGSGALAIMNDSLDNVSTIDINMASVGATAGLNTVLTPTDLINRLNDGGPDVSGKYADYARAKVQIAQARIQAAAGYAQEATLRLSFLRSYIEESGAWNRIAETFIAEASQRVGEAGVYLATAQARLVEMDGYLAEAGRNQEVVANDMLLSDRFRAEAQIRMAEFNRLLDSKAEYRKRVVSIPVRQPK